MLATGVQENIDNPANVHSGILLCMLVAYFIRVDCEDSDQAWRVSRLIQTSAFCWFRNAAAYYTKASQKISVLIALANMHARAFAARIHEKMT